MRLSIKLQSVVAATHEPSSHLTGASVGHLYHEGHWMRLDLHEPSGHTTGKSLGQASRGCALQALEFDWQEPSGHLTGLVSGQEVKVGHWAKVSAQKPPGQVLSGVPKVLSQLMSSGLTWLQSNPLSWQLPSSHRTGEDGEQVTGVEQRV
mmetsp:Transcript_23671/g.33080  ORF Transcript_23671/g.33080 Transcript_23671/m.33080 type:complete len:150 (-) Transcript_23671:18-467(-)